MDKQPHKPGYYWIFCGGSTRPDPEWEIAEWDGEEWWVFGREYSYKTEDLKVTNWDGPLVYGG